MLSKCLTESRARSPPASGGGCSEAVADGTIGQRLGKVDAPDAIGAIEIGEGPRHFQDPVIAAGREMHGLGRALQKRHGRCIGGGNLLDQRGGALGVGRDVRVAEREIAFALDGSRGRLS